ncbi:MAG: glycerophosphodiester phosphodiesterase family protein [Planktomarina sp.]
MIHLPAGYTDRPFAHRGLHNRDAGIIENSLSAIMAAVEAGYGIEIDVQLSSDKVPMVFHDYSLQRLTGQVGVIQKTRSDDLEQMVLTDGIDTVRSLQEVLTMVEGRVPLLIEIKDQDGNMGPNVGALERAVAADLEGYVGDVAIMSFNPHAIAAFREYNKTLPVGLVTDPYDPADWPTVSKDRLAELATIPDAAPLGCSFISHNVDDLQSDAVAAQKSAGLAILCWTVKSAKVEARARQIVDTVTFEGYAA